MSHRQSVRFFGLCLLLLLGVQGAPGHAQSSDAFDGSRMKRDLDIMEVILDKMLGEGDSAYTAFPGNSRVRGIYLADYGVIMFVDSSEPSAFQFALPDLDFSLSDISGLVDSQVNIVRHDAHLLDKETHDDHGRAHRRNLRDLEKNVTEFLGSYADAIGQLKPEDKITIVVNIEEGNYRSPNESVVQPLYLQVSVAKQNVSKFKLGQLTQKQFSATFTSDQAGDSGTVGKELAIMRNILQTSLSRKYNPDFAVRQATAFYLNDVGAIFLIDASASPFEFTFLSKFGEDSAEQARVRTVKSGGGPSKNASFAVFKKNLIQLIADYGQTLKFLSPEQKVVVHVEGKKTLANGVTSLLLRLKKSDLDAFARGTIQLSELEKRMYSKQF